MNLTLEDGETRLVACTPEGAHVWSRALRELEDYEFTGGRLFVAALGLAKGTHSVWVAGHRVWYELDLTHGELLRRVLYMRTTPQILSMAWQGHWLAVLHPHALRVLDTEHELDPLCTLPYTTRERFPELDLTTTHVTVTADGVDVCSWDLQLWERVHQLEAKLKTALARPQRPAPVALVTLLLGSLAALALAYCGTFSFKSRM